MDCPHASQNLMFNNLENLLVSMYCLFFNDLSACDIVVFYVLEPGIGSRQNLSLKTIHCGRVGLRAVVTAI